MFILECFHDYDHKKNGLQHLIVDLSCKTSVNSAIYACPEYSFANVLFPYALSAWLMLVKYYGREVKIFQTVKVCMLSIISMFSLRFEKEVET